MRAEGNRRLDTLLARPWVFVVAVALLVGLPVLALGQASDDETRNRARATQLANTSYTAEIITRTYVDHAVQIRNTLASLVVSPSPDTSPLALAVARGDTASLQAVADLVRNQYPRYVIRSYVALRGSADTISDATVVAVSPPAPSYAGRRLADLGQPLWTAFGTILGPQPLTSTGMIAPPYIAGPDEPSRLLVAVAIPGRGRTPACGALCAQITSPALLFAELDNARLFADAAEPSLGPSDDAYALDPAHRLVARVRAPVPYPLRDLAGDPVLDEVAPSTLRIQRANVSDPVVGDSRTIATWPLQLATIIGLNGPHAVVVSRDTSVADREIDATLGQLAVFRFGIVLLLVVLAGLGGVAARHFTMSAVYRERLRLARDLHDLLGHSLSLMTLKTQVARRMLVASDPAGAAAEIAEMERVARESLEDVRGAVDGYRQPTFGSALVGARAALAAAGIDSTLENAAGPLPAAVDATFAWVLREAVTNVIRHSRAARCTVRLTRRASDALLEVIDDGTAGGEVVTGNGLAGLRERAVARGGHADAGPLPGGGFRVQVSIPV